MINNENLLSTSEAKQFLEDWLNFTISKTSIITWCMKYNVGEKIVGRWYIHKDKLIQLIESNIFEEGGEQ